MPKKPSEMTDEELEAAYKALPAKPAAPKKASEMTDAELEAAYNKVQAKQPSFMKDVKEGSYPALQRGIVGLQTSPVTLADQAVRGAGFIGRHLPYTSDEFAKKVGDYTESARNALDPYTYGGALDKAAKYDPEILHQNETTPGKFLQTGIEFAPGTVAAALTGGESALPTIIKGASSAVGSEGAGQLADWLSPESGWGDYARMGGALLGLGGPGTVRKLASPGTPRTAAGAERLAKAQTLAKADVPVSAAQQTGSRLWGTLEGRPPTNQGGKLSEAMLKKGGVQPGPTVEKALEARNTELGQRAGNLRSNTAINVDNDLRTKLIKETNDHINRFQGKASLYDPQVQQGLDDFTGLVNKGKLSGADYADLRSKWRKGPKELQNMARHLDDAMEASHPGQWSGYYNDVADYKALSKGANQADAGGVIPPRAVNPKRPTELGELSKAGKLVEPSSFPAPYSLDPAASSITGAAAGAVGGAEKGVLINLLTHGAEKIARATTGPIARSAPVQSWGKLHYWTPNEYTSLPNKRVGAMLSGTPAGQFFEPPNDASQ